MYRILLVDDEALIREAVSENVKWDAVERKAMRRLSDSKNHYFERV